jgi:hypothetical protein
MSTTAPASAIDADTLRRSIYGKGAASRTDLIGLMGLGAQGGDGPGYLALVADVARDALVLEVDPPGYVSDADADWLTDHLGDGGGIASRAEFEALKSVVTHAVSVPPSLIAFGVREVERAILTGRRESIGGVECEPGVVTAADVEALRMLVFAPRAEAACHVDRASAEALFDIAHATAAAPNDPAFADFFARAVGNYLIGAVFVQAPSRAEAIAMERELDRRESFGQFFSGLIGGRFSRSSAPALKSVDQLADDRYSQENAETEARLEAASRIDAGEAKWILAHLTRGGELCAAEKRLLVFLRDEAASAPPEITALFESAA